MDRIMPRTHKAGLPTRRPPSSSSCFANPMDEAQSWVSMLKMALDNFRDLLAVRNVVLQATSDDSVQSLRRAFGDETARQLSTRYRHDLAQVTAEIEALVRAWTSGAGEVHAVGTLYTVADDGDYRMGACSLSFHGNGVAVTVDVAGVSTMSIKGLPSSPPLRRAVAAPVVAGYFPANAVVCGQETV